MFRLCARVLSWTGTFLLLMGSKPSVLVAHLSNAAAAHEGASQRGPTPANTPAAASMATAHRPFACQPPAEGEPAEAPAAALPHGDLAAMQGRVGGMALAQVSGAVPRMSASAATSPSRLPEATALRLSQSAATSPHVHRQPPAGAAPSGEEHTCSHSCAP